MGGHNVECLEKLFGRPCKCVQCEPPDFEAYMKALTEPFDENEIMEKAEKRANAAIRNAALEEAAKVCDKKAERMRPTMHESNWNHAKMEAHQIDAKAIRALKTDREV